MAGTRRTRKALSVAAVLTVVAGALVAVGEPAAVAAGASPRVSTVTPQLTWPTPDPTHIQTLTSVLQTMQSNYATFAHRTPGPQDIFDYNIGNLWMKGVDGTGTTVAVIEGWDDPGIDAAIHTFDTRYGLPDPTIETVYPSGPLPAQCPAGMLALGSFGSCDAWVGELRLDVEAVHLMAPYAKIIISATPADSEVTDDAASNVAPPEMMRALEYLSANHLADAISISDGIGESDYTSGAAQIHANDPGPLWAAAEGVPVLNATGDCGVVQNLAAANSQCGDVSAGPSTATWDDNPWVTAVGGTVPNVSATDGSKLGPDPIWHVGGIFSEGAGFSSIYPRPAYQNGVAKITGSSMRSVPDITMDSQDGTSESAPMFAGVLALATQLNGGQVLGPINPVLYNLLGRKGASAGISDVVSGNNSVIDPSNGNVLVQGFTAAPGFDVASGWGTIDASTFVPALVTAIQTSSLTGSARQQAAAELVRLRNQVTSLRQFDRTFAVFSAGYLPGHPVTLALDGTNIATLTAAANGTVSDIIDANALGLSPGAHTVTFASMLITKTGSFGR